MKTPMRRRAVAKGSGVVVVNTRDGACCAAGPHRSNYMQRARTEPHVCRPMNSSRREEGESGKIGTLVPFLPDDTPAGGSIGLFPMAALCCIPPSTNPDQNSSREKTSGNRGRCRAAGHGRDAHMQNRPWTTEQSTIIPWGAKKKRT